MSTQLLRSALREQAKTGAKEISDQVQKGISSANQAAVQQRQMER